MNNTTLTYPYPTPHLCMRYINILHFIYDLFAVPFYISLLIVIWCRRSKSPFKSSFYRLCIPLGAVDVLQLLWTTWLIRLPLWGWLPDRWEMYLLTKGQHLARATIATAYYFGFWQTTAVVCLAFNRYTALVTPQSHQRIWSCNAVLCATVIQSLILPFFSVLPTFLADFKFVRDTYSGEMGIAPVFASALFKRRYMLVAVVMSVCALFVCTVLYTFALRSAWKHAHTKRRKFSQRSGSSMASRASMFFEFGAEIKTTIVGFVTFIATACAAVRSASALLYLTSATLTFSPKVFLNTIAVVMLMLSRENRFRLISMRVWYITSDIFASINPYLLLGLAPAVRLEYRRFWFNKLPGFLICGCLSSEDLMDPDSQRGPRRKYGRAEMLRMKTRKKSSSSVKHQRNGNSEAPRSREAKKSSMKDSGVESNEQQNVSLELEYVDAIEISL